MKPIHTKAGLAVALSRLRGFSDPQVRLEQYVTDSDVAAQVLWTAHMNDELLDKKMADLGAGTGILGIGALLLGAREVIFVESEKTAIKILIKNLEWVKANYEFSGKYRLLEADIQDFREQVDIVVENPPFGTKMTHLDKIFLEKAMQSAPVIYSLHKSTSTAFIQAISRDHGFSAHESGKFLYPLPATMAHHTKKRAFIEVSLFILRK